jgi:formate dehydrogenase major subunit
MIREKPSDPWRKVSWEEAIEYTAKQFIGIQAKYGRTSIGGITSSRTTNEEVWVVQKMIRTAFRNNNTDTCARVCHSPTGYGLGQTFGTSAGTQDFASVDETDLVLLIGANPTDAHPVFASRMKARLREGADLIVCDPRRIDLVESPHIKASVHLPLLPGSNVALINALAHTIVVTWTTSRNAATWMPSPSGLSSSNNQRTHRKPWHTCLAAIPPKYAKLLVVTPRRNAPQSITVSASPNTRRARPW